MKEHTAPHHTSHLAHHASHEAPFLSVIIPSYNESHRLPKTLIDIDKHLSKVDYHYEILVVNDGSKDNTGEVVKKMEGSIKNLVLIDNEVNKGKGGVVKQGMLAAKGRVRLFTDADNSTSIDQFAHMLPFFKEGYQVVIGSRAIKGARLHPPQPWYRQIAGRGGNLIIQTLVLPGIWDTQCGFKAFTAEAAEKIFQHMKMERWSFDIEVLALAKLYKFRIKEIPVSWVNDIHSRVDASAYIKVLRDTLLIRWWLWTNKYKPLPIKRP